MRQSDCGTPLADFGPEYVLFFRAEASTPAWSSFVLRLDVPRRAAPKRAWWLGHDGARLARNSDAGHLAKNHPGIYSAVERFLAAWVLAQRMLAP